MTFWANKGPFPQPSDVQRSKRRGLRPQGLCDAHTDTKQINSVTISAQVRAGCDETFRKGAHKADCPGQEELSKEMDSSKDSVVCLMSDVHLPNIQFSGY